MWDLEVLVAVQSGCFQWQHHTEEACPRAALGTLPLEQEASYKFSTSFL